MPNPTPFLTAEQVSLLKSEKNKSVILADMEGKVVAFNPGAENIFGYTKKEATGIHVRQFHPPQNYARILPELFRTALQKGKYDNIIPLARKNGEEFAGHIVVTTVTDADKKIVGLIGVTEEVTFLPRKTILARWLQGVRAPFFSATLIPIFLGTVIGFQASGVFSFWNFFWVIIGMLFIHAGVNMANDYFDHKSGNDALNQNPTPFSGGSRVIQEGLIPPNHIRNAFLFCLGTGSVIGLYLNSLFPGNVILIIGLVGVFIGYFYSSPPFAASYHRLGELFVMMGFGPLIVLGSYYVQHPVFSWIPIIASLPLAILIGLVLFLNQFPDYDADKKAGKRNVTNTIGKDRSTLVLIGGVSLTYAILGIGILTGIFPALTAICIITFPMSLTLIELVKKNAHAILELIPANAEMITLHFVFGVLFVLGFLFGR